MLTRDQILKTNDIKTKEIQVPEWNDSILIRQLTRGDQDEYMKRQFGKSTIENKDKGQKITEFSIYGHDAWLCTHGICNPDGTLMFGDADIVELKKHNGEVIGRIAKEILEFSGMVEDAETAATLAEEIKN